jgi:hypothetical protein
VISDQFSVIRVEVFKQSEVPERNIQNIFIIFTTLLMERPGHDELFSGIKAMILDNEDTDCGG